MADQKALPTIPDVPATADSKVKAWMTAVKEALEVRLGRRGDPLDTAVTKRDLVTGGIAVIASQRTGSLGPTERPDPNASITPPAPVAFQAIGVFGGITLTWDSPDAMYNVHAYTEIWRSEKPDVTTRRLLTAQRGTIYFDRIADSEAATYYYWIRFMSEYGKAGPFSAVVKAEKQRDVDDIMREISGSIDESDLSKVFQADYQANKNALALATQKLEAQGASIQQQSQINANYDKVIGNQADAITGLQAQWSVTLNVNGYVSGLATNNNGKTADFAVLADRFWIASPGSTGKIKPFIVQDMKVYIDTALIRDASIQEGKLGPITFGKIKDGAGNPVTTVNGRLRADMIEVNDLRFDFGQVTGSLKSTATGYNGQPRWILDRNGTLAMNGPASGGRLELTDAFVKVYDENGVKRVQLGDLWA